MSAARVLLVDNYDSFTHNLAHLSVCSARRSTWCATTRRPSMRARSPRTTSCASGPGRAVRKTRAARWKRSAGRCDCGRPLLGVCLGQQAIGEYFGGVVEHAPQLMHGKTSQITHDGSGVFRGVPSPFSATRYHSLCVAHVPFPAEFGPTRRSEDGVIQGIAHRHFPIHGVQFHPESVLTPGGRRDIRELSRDSCDRERRFSRACCACWWRAARPRCGVDGGSDRRDHGCRLVARAIRRVFGGAGQ